MIVHVNLLSVKIIDKQLADHRKQNEREKVAMPNRVHVNLKERMKENIMTKHVLQNSQEFQKVHIWKNIMTTCCWETLTKNIKKEAAGFVQEKTLVKDLIKPVTGFMPAAKNKNRVLLVCSWRHGGHVGGQEQKRLSPLGTKLHSNVNSSRKILLIWSPTWPPCHVVVNQEHI